MGVNRSEPLFPGIKAKPAFASLESRHADTTPTSPCYTFTRRSHRGAGTDPTHTCARHTHTTQADSTFFIFGWVMKAKRGEVI